VCAGARLAIRVIPRAKKTQFGGKRQGRLVVRLQAPPVEGAANRALCKFLAKVLGVSAGDVEIISGLHSREKVVLVHGLSEQQLRRRLADAGAEL